MPSDRPRHEPTQAYTRAIGLWARREDVRTVVAVGEAPAVALNRVEAAARDSGYPVDRSDNRVTIGGPVAVADYLVAEAMEMDVGTRIELRGRIDPEITHRVLRELSKSRPWTWAPSWDERRPSR